MKAPRDGRQLNLFSDPRREWALAVIEALEQNADKINYLHDLMQKVLGGVPGYATPEHAKRMRLFRQRQRRVLRIGSTTLIATTQVTRLSQVARRTRATGHQLAEFSR